jgi:hypothetical protein
MPTISVKDGGTWKEAKEILVKDSGTWKPVKEVHVKDGGVWKKAFPESGTQVYSTAGTYSFVVPNGIYSLTVPLLVGAGGGGSGTNGAGDIWGGGGGGSGGYRESQTISVTPGETLTIVVGAGGLSGRVTFNGSLLCSGTNGTSVAGTNGGTTSISRGGTSLLNATGGVAGTPAPNGDNGPGAPGAGGSPNGVSGSYQSPIQRNNFAAGAGGNNGKGYGTGGAGNGQSPFTCPTQGGTGYVSLSW